MSTVSAVSGHGVAEVDAEAAVVVPGIAIDQPERDRLSGADEGELIRVGSARLGQGPTVSTLGRIQPWPTFAWKFAYGRGSVWPAQEPPARGSAKMNSVSVPTWPIHRRS